MKTKEFFIYLNLAFLFRKTFTIFALGILLLGGSAMVNNARAGVTLMRDMSAGDQGALSALTPRFAEDSVECSRNWSVYDEHYKHGDIGYAYEAWKYLFEYCPELTINIYVHGIPIVKFQYDNETDPEKKQEWLDLLMKVYDQRIEHFGREGYVLGRKAVTLYQLQPDATEALYEMTSRSLELMGDNAESPVLQIHFLSAARLVDAGVLETEKLVEIFSEVMETIDFNLAQDPEDKGYYQNTRSTILTLFKPYGTCENLTTIFERRFNENPDNTALMTQIAQMLDQAGCLDSELYFRVTERLYQIEPDAGKAALLGRLETKRENYENAIEYLQQAANLYEGNGSTQQDNLFRTYWQMADMSYRQLELPSKAREYALKAHEAKPTDGRPLVLIGEMYVASASYCGSDEFAKKAVYWAAVDQFAEAARVAEDPDVKEKAQQLADAYREYFPNNEEIFFYGHTVGATYRVNCWINETTVIRAR
ncbi:MAG: tetratricopeptide repeat protein [Bacteroides sp.]|jgi:tetratricopeptide (TPR) repeat protein|nr:tetratricopeptide repeat protein [Bacteroides sp.]